MTVRFVLRDARAVDASAVAALHVASWRSAYRGIFSDAYLDGPVEAERLVLWHERLTKPSPRRLTLLAVAEERIVGFACCVVDGDPLWGSFVNNLHADPAHRGSGVGRGLMRGVAARLLGPAPERPVHLFCLEANRPARVFYERLGGEVAERLDADEPDGGRYPVCRYRWSTPAALLAACD